MTTITTNINKDENNNNTDQWMDLAIDTTEKKSNTTTLNAMEYLMQTLSKKDATIIINNLGATTMEDLKLVDHGMASNATQDLKLIPRKKAMIALMAISAEKNKHEFSTKKDDDNGNSTKTTSNSDNMNNNNNNPTSNITNNNEAEKINNEPPFIQEAVAICIDRSGSMGTAFEETQSWNDDGNQNALNKIREKRTRMEAVKQVFYAFRDRTETLGEIADAGKHEIGLIQFDNEVETMLNLTGSLSKFESIVDNMKKRGSTAIYSAILQGVKMLKDKFTKSPKTDLRILVLTDGQNNAGVLPRVALEAVNTIGAVVDAIIVGNSPDRDLQRIVEATGGSCFQIKSLAEGFELMESEAVVSLRARRGGFEKPVFVHRSIPDVFSKIHIKNITSSRNASRVMLQKNTMKKVKAITIGAMAAKTTTTTTALSGRSRRIMKELTNMAKGDSNVWVHSGTGIHLFPCSDDLSHLKALIEGPINTPFANGVFALNVTIPNGYPFQAPRISFDTPIYHCNVSDTGRICLELLESKWSPNLSIPKIIESIRIMMIHPDTNNALRQWIAELTIMHRQSGGADKRYMDAASEATKQNASKSVDEWKKEWGL